MKITDNSHCRPEAKFGVLTFYECCGGIFTVGKLLAWAKVFALKFIRSSVKYEIIQKGPMH
jgi:hypothetical protein